MTQRKILFTDLDGTLLDSEKNISKHVYDKIIEMTNAGHIFVLASGRSLASILQVKEHIGLIDQKGVFITAFNGALIYDCANHKVVSEHRFPLDITKTIYALGIQEHVHCHTYDDTHILTPEHDEELDFYRINIHQPYHLTNDLTPYLTDGQGPHKMLAISVHDHALLEDFKKKVYEYPFADQISTAFSNEHLLEFFSCKAGKGNSLLTLCDILSIPVENSYAMGDAENDISMIQSAGTGIAMANATDAVKAIANYITITDNDHDGMAEVIDKFFL